MDFKTAFIFEKRYQSTRNWFPKEDHRSAITRYRHTGKPPIYFLQDCNPRVPKPVVFKACFVIRWRYSTERPKNADDGLETIHDSLPTLKPMDCISKVPIDIDFSG